jgi:hypothetical protein
MEYSAEKYEYLFNQSQSLDDALELLRHGEVFRYRVKTITSGKVRECEAFPIWSTKAQAHAARANTNREAQKILNKNNSIKRCRRLVDNNFTINDYMVTMTYGSDQDLPDEKQARKDIRNYLRRARADAKKHGRELKYLYVIEWFNGDGRRARVHHHVFLSGVDRDTAENLWTYGRCNADRLKPENGTLAGLAIYTLKQPKEGWRTRRWQGSQNLKKPTVTIADTKLSKRQIERLAEDIENAAPLIIGGQFPSYCIDEVVFKRSGFVAGAYVYAIMHKPEPPPNRRKPKRRLQT